MKLWKSGTAMMAATALMTITPIAVTCLPASAHAQDTTTSDGAQTTTPAPTDSSAPTPASTTPAAPVTDNSSTPPAPDDSTISGRISAINITGNKNITSAAIYAIIRQKVGDDYNPNSAEADRQAIQDMGYFGAVTEHAAPGANPGDVIVTYTMIENPKVSRIVFTGNTVESTAKLQAVIQTKAGQVLDTNTLAQDTQNIIQVYSTDGYRASISEDINLDYTTGVLTLPIIEAKVSSLTITGNRRTKPYVILRELKRAWVEKQLQCSAAARLPALPKSLRPQPSWTRLSLREGCASRRRPGRNPRHPRTSSSSPRRQSSLKRRTGKLRSSRQVRSAAERHRRFPLYPWSGETLVPATLRALTALR